jgi:proteasome accessory factor A
MSEVLPRITGFEMEYSARVKTATNATWHQAADTLVKDGNLLSNLPTGVEHMGFYLSNGAKYYRDVGDHPEYATPEDTDFMSVVLSEIAGERIVAATFEAFKEKI